MRILTISCRPPTSPQPPPSTTVFIAVLQTPTPTLRLPTLAPILPILHSTTTHLSSSRRPPMLRHTPHKMGFIEHIIIISNLEFKFSSTCRANTGAIQASRADTVAPVPGQTTATDAYICGGRGGGGGSSATSLSFPPEVDIKKGFGHIQSHRDNPRTMTSAPFRTGRHPD
jgi:hypothetical protein